MGVPLGDVIVDCPLVPLKQLFIAEKPFPQLLQPLLGRQSIVWKMRWLISPRKSYLVMARDDLN